LPQAETSWGEARDLWRALAAEFDAHPAYRYELSDTLYELGRLQAGTGRSHEAEKTYREAITFQDRLVREQPDNVPYVEALANSHNSLGVLYNDGNRYPEAIPAFEEGRKLRQRVVEKLPGNKAGPNHFLANSWMNLGGAHLQARQLAEAETAYRQALALQQPLGEAPNAPAHDRQQLGWICKGLANLCQEQKRLEEAEAHGVRALEIFRRLLREQPGHLEYGVDLANTLVALGYVCRGRERLQAALDWFDQAATVCQGLRLVAPGHQAVREFLCAARLGRAQLLGRLNRHAEAVREWDGALEAAPPEQRSELRLGRAWSLVRAGDHARAAAEADELAALRGVPDAALYRLACLQAQCAESAGQDAQLAPAEKEARRARALDRALALLKRADAAGYFRDPARREAARKEPDLAPLRGRPEFTRLLGDP
jgi:tetratricopeptide (TPR) repeat protein